MDEITGQFTFLAYDRSGRIFRYPKIEGIFLDSYSVLLKCVGSKSVYIEQWKDYKPSKQYEMEKKDYLVYVFVQEK
jgi:hypothetical protein